MVNYPVRFDVYMVNYPVRFDVDIVNYLVRSNVRCLKNSQGSITFAMAGYFGKRSMCCHAHSSCNCVCLHDMLGKCSGHINIILCRVWGTHAIVKSWNVYLWHSWLNINIATSWYAHTRWAEYTVRPSISLGT